MATNRSVMWRWVTMGLLALLFGCSDKDDFQREGDVWRYRGQLIEGADERSFQVLDAHYAKDATQVWWADTQRKGQEYYLVAHAVVRRLEGADAASFRMLTHRYARDRSRVYYEGREVRVADVEGFEPLDNGFARDRRQAYYHRAPIVGSAGAPGFRVLDSFHADDGQRIFHAHVDYSSGQSRVRQLTGVDRASFQVLPSRWSRDARSLFFEGRKVPGDPNSFQVLDIGYVRTSAQVFYLGKPVAGADAASFQMLERVDESDGADARDARRRYRRGEWVKAGEAG